MFSGAQLFLVNVRSYDLKGYASILEDLTTKGRRTAENQFHLASVSKYISQVDQKLPTHIFYALYIALYLVFFNFPQMSIVIPGAQPPLGVFEGARGDAGIAGVEKPMDRIRLLGCHFITEKQDHQHHS